MNTTQMLAITIIAVCTTNLAAIVYFARQRVKRERDLRQLAERQDANGRKLLMIARWMRNQANHVHDEPTNADTLRRWAATCERAALEHLEAINAIGLQALSDVSGRTVHLGQFNRKDSTAAVIANTVKHTREGARHA